MQGTRAINIMPVKYFGETEFWLSGGKVILMGIVFSFTFVSMVGGNPKHDAYGFRYWSNPVGLPSLLMHPTFDRLTSMLRARLLNTSPLVALVNLKASLRLFGKPLSPLLVPNISLWSLAKLNYRVSP